MSELGSWCKDEIQPELAWMQWVEVYGFSASGVGGTWGAKKPKCAKSAWVHPCCNESAVKVESRIRLRVHEVKRVLQHTPMESPERPLLPAQ